MNLLALFFAGALVCNCIPHLAAGLQGVPFPTPFAKPRGVGASPPLLNFLWGSLNFVAGLAILDAYSGILGAGMSRAAIAAGALSLGIHLSRHFGKVRSSAPVALTADQAPHKRLPDQ